MLGMMVLVAMVSAPVACLSRLHARRHQEHSALGAFTGAFQAHIRMHRASMLDIRCRHVRISLIATAMMLILTVVSMDGAVTMIVVALRILLFTDGLVPSHDSLPIL